MPSHYSDMGFVVNSLDDIKNIHKHYNNIGSCKKTKAGKGLYCFFSVGEYIEFWIQATKQMQIVDLEFHYNGKSVNQLTFQSWMRLNKNKQAGLLQCTYQSMPLNLNIPNAGLLPKLKKGSAYKMQISCFSETISFSKSEAEFVSEQEEKEYKLGVRHFIPSGTFSPNNDPNFKQEANAIFGGVVLEYEKRINPYSQKEYFWFLVDSYGLVLDVLSDASCVPDDIDKGFVLSGSFWLSAKIV